MKEESPLKALIDKMYERLAEPNITTAKLSQIIHLAANGREGLLEPGGLPEHDWWANQAIKDFTEIIVRANCIAQKILNPGITMPDVEEQVKKALKQANRRIKYNKTRRKQSEA